MFPPITFANSTTVTFEPNLDQTEPSSKPITPPPITTMVSGTFSNSNAPVLVTTVFSSTSTPFNLAGSDPVAKIIFFVEIVSFVPSSFVTSTVFLSTKLPNPIT